VSTPPGSLVGSEGAPPFQPAPPEPVQFEQVTLDPDPGLGPSGDPINPFAAQLLPEQVCRHFQMIPVSYSDGELTLALADPYNAMAQSVAYALTNDQLRVVVARPEEIDRAIERVYGVPGGPAPEPGETVDDAVERERLAEAGRLGEILIAQGLISEDDLALALDMQARTGSRLGEILYHGRLIDEAQVASALAEQLRVPLLDLEGVEPEPDALAIIPESLQRAARCLPLAIDGDVLHVAIVDPLDDDTFATIREHTDLRIQVYLVQRTQLDAVLRRVHQAEYIRAARTELLSRFPEDCANRVLSPAQRTFFLVAIFITIVCAVIWPLNTAIAFVVTCVVIYALVSIYKFKLFFDSFGRRKEIVIEPEELARVDERELPDYTVLVPLYDEAEVLPGLVANLASLDYPREKLEVLLLAEEDDDVTLAAINAMQDAGELPPSFKTIVVPDSQPKTKPKACNYGLVQATGRYVVIYDAEDRPDPDQLKKVILAWERLDPDVVCVQCKLNYYNTDTNLLTRFFATEYALWFDLLLPGLDASGAPIPLGGTSNHFDREVLLELGLWDPFNTTEDADLGIRLHKGGYKTAMLDSTTLEEANSVLPNWVRQRSRWVKGYLQTYLVHMRHPLKLMREIGFRSFLSFQFIIGGTIVFLLNPIFWLLTTLWLLTEANIIEQLFPGFIYYAASFQLFLGNFIFAYLAVAGSMQRRLFGLTKYALFSPLYWGLMSIGAYRGFFQLFTKPFYWEKTQHGLVAPSAPPVGRAAP